MDKFHANDIPNYKLKLIPSSQVKLGKYHVPVHKEDMAENRFDKVLYHIRQQRLQEDWRQGKFRIIPLLREATPPRRKKKKGSSRKRKRSSSSRKKAGQGLDSAEPASQKLISLTKALPYEPGPDTDTTEAFEGL